MLSFGRAVTGPKIVGAHIAVLFVRRGSHGWQGQDMEDSRSCPRRDGRCIVLSWVVAAFRSTFSTQPNRIMSRGSHRPAKSNVDSLRSLVFLQPHPSATPACSPLLRPGAFCRRLPVCSPARFDVSRCSPLVLLAPAPSLDSARAFHTRLSALALPAPAPQLSRLSRVVPLPYAR